MAPQGLDRVILEDTFTPKGNATLRDLTSDTRFKSGLMRLLTPLLALVSKLHVMTDLQKLKSLVEKA